MSIVVEILYTKKLEKAKLALGSDSDLDTIEMGLDEILESENINGHQDKVETKGRTLGLDDAYWDDLFSESPIPSSVIDAAIREESEGRF